MSTYRVVRTGDPMFACRVTVKASSLAEALDIASDKCGWPDTKGAHEKIYVDVRSKGRWVPPFPEMEKARLHSKIRRSR